ncbi:MAG: thiamine pyrophosphate-dependent enzyme [Candidatus Diapherotrites archaeon]|nr:thiamine pyrophosphate-dependent enzyme [Candidatus Diapherotrites archaeon]
MKEVVLGDEALALGAVHAGISAAFAYPGTPSTEITEFLIRHREKFGIHTEWCSNEKTAFEAALGVSFAGKRALVSMKHVGLNVAMDAFVNAAVSGIKGGLVVAVADDPGMHSSQNEQDSRYLAEFAKIFTFEPCNAQEAYDMALQAFDLSEKLGIPVMIRLVTRLSHVRESIQTGKQRGQNALDTEMRLRDWVLLPGNARNQFQKLLEKQPLLLKESEKSKFNESKKGKGKKCVVCAGNAFNYFMEATGGSLPYFKVSTYPLPESKIRKFCASFKEILVLEEGYPYIEEKMLSIVRCKERKITGKMSGLIQMAGELNPESVKKALGIKVLEPVKVKISLAQRPPQFCAGCPHADLYRALNEAKGSSQIMVFGDIGCYTLGALPPFTAISSCICMGSSVNLARGASIAGAAPSVGVIGDSTFVHGGMPALVEAAKHNNNMKLLILDNSTVAMTGGQETMVKGDAMVELIAGLGVPRAHIKIIEPLPARHEENVKILKEEFAYAGVSVIISRRLCIQSLKKGFR